ncbi:hypothetical protein RN001_008323 [Aquatica leii]|uniref:Uncharacterized protein n=1 Tax=Aquatica leii TaxID=1421715 RepID=A0AAN7PZ25_9COLE|nr:hypothetical protein RN001_008323 [Aquatica leii]
MLLRHVIEVFTDVWDQSNHVQVFQNFKNYNNKIDLMILELESILHDGGGDMRSENNNEFANLGIKFLNFVLKLRQPNLPTLNSRLVNIALNWIKVDSVCSEALTLLRAVDVNCSSVLEPFLNYLPIFLRSITNGDDEIPTCIENNKKINSLIEILRVLVQSENIRKRVLAMVKEELFTKIFTPLIGTSSTSGMTNLNTCSTGSILLYVNCLALIYDLSKYDDYWIPLYNGSKETKALTLTISSGPYFPIAEVSTAMCELQAFTQIDFPVQESNHRRKDDNLYSMMSVTQMYHAEQAGRASLEAVSSRCTYLQHTTAQLKAELTALRSDLSLKEKTINEKTQLLEEYAKQLTRLEEENRILEDKNNHLKLVVAKLEDKLKIAGLF